MCRSSAEGGRRCPGGGRKPAGHAGDMSPAMARLLGTDTPEGAARFERLSALRDSGYTGPVDQEGNAISEAGARKSPQERREATALEDMKAEMRKWRALPIPQAGPAEPMSPQKAKLLGCDTPEGLARYERLRAYREAGYDGPLDSSSSIPDPDSPAEQRSLDMLAALSLTHS